MSVKNLVVPRSTLQISGFANGHWRFPEQMGIGSGFVYVIRDRVLHKLYMGKKCFRGSRGSKRGVESNWRTYKSSSPILKAMFKERPMTEFDMIVLEVYETKSGLNYAETWSLCLVEAPTSEEWYNTRIEAVSWNVKERVTDRHKARLIRVMNWEEINDG